jgi:RNA polymerase sigma-70 factor, ECF subfamily
MSRLIDRPPRGGNEEERRLGDVRADLAALLTRIAKGDERAFAALYDELAPTLYGVVLRVVDDPAQSEAITRQAFVELWREAARFDSTCGGVRGWAVKIAHRRAVEHVRSAQPRHDRRRSDAAEPAAAGGPPGAPVETHDRARARQLLTQLNGVHREALELAYFDGLTHAGVAEQLGVALGTAKSLITEGLLRLRTLSDAHA